MKEFKFHKNIEGLAMSQSPLIDKVFPLLDEPQLIIEIGTWKGGFALFLRSIFPNAEIHTFDITNIGNQQAKAKVFKKDKIKSHIENCFESQLCIDLVKSSKKKLLLCGGGNKTNEFNFFVPLLRKGDTAGIHCFAPTLQHFKKEIEWKFWNTSFESDEARISQWLKDHIERHKHFDKFLKVVWGLYTRK